MSELLEKPTKQILHILAGIGEDFEEIFKIARKEQDTHGLDLIPPNCEMEMAAARYRILFDHLKNPAAEISARRKKNPKI